MNFYFRQFWKDPRLAFQRSGIDALSFGHEFSKSIWLPDTFFVNEKQGFAHSITAKNEFIKIRNTGDVIRSVRYIGHESRKNNNNNRYFEYQTIFFFLEMQLD